MNPSNFMSEDKGLLLDGMFYVWCVGCLIVGIFYSIYSVYELYDLIKRVYGYNKKEIEQKITVAEEQMNRTRKKLRENDIYQD